MTRILLFLFFILWGFTSFAQAPPSSTFRGYSGFNPETHEEIPDEYRTLIQTQIRNNITDLERRGISARSSLHRPASGVKFSFPLRQASGYNDPSFYGISNFVDRNPTGQPQDFNCGTRTYKNHKGTDFFTAPFWWRKMDEDAVEIIAAADGIIIYKDGSQDDKNCVNCADDAPASCFYWNAVYVQHADGTIAFYGHMKKNSLTTKKVGETVRKGEFLGIVGSSGNSSGPHLHFEIWNNENFTEFYDPWVGSCNSDITESMWENQEPYYNHKILKIMSSPENIVRWKECYDGSPEVDDSKTTFALGEKVVITPFVRDNITNGPNYKMRLIKPNGDVLYDWTLNAYTGHYTWVYFYYEFNSTMINMVGTWKFQLTYDQDFVEHEFEVVDALPLHLLSFNGKKANDFIRLDWQVANEVNASHFEIEKSSDASSFLPIAKVKATNDGQKGNHSYSYNDMNPTQGTQYYRLRMLDIDGSFNYSEVVKVDFGFDLPVKVFPNPATHYVDLKNVSGYNALKIVNLNGQTVYSKKITGNEDRIDIGQLASGIYVLHLSGNQKEQKIKLMKK